MTINSLTKVKYQIKYTNEFKKIIKRQKSNARILKNLNI